METVDVFAICYNEEVMLPYFIKHYKDNFNANITVYDNYSTDKSPQIIKDSGCKLISYDSKNQIRDDLYLQIKNNCWKKSKADWVIVCDIDELLTVNFDISQCSIIATKGHDMIGLPPSDLGVVNHMYSKYIMFRPRQIKEINYIPGCHFCSPVGKVLQSQSVATLRHYKYISEQYVYDRHMLYQSRLSEINKLLGWGIEYQNVELQKIKDKFSSLKANSVVILG